jgi:hypothetical protein
VYETARRAHADRVSHSRPPHATAPDPDAALRCGECGREVRRADTTECAVCQRRVCIAHVGPYGHHMSVCDECRLAEW